MVLSVILWRKTGEFHCCYEIMKSDRRYQLKTSNAFPTRYPELADLGDHSVSSLDICTKNRVEAPGIPTGGKLDKVTSLSLSNLKIWIRCLRQNINTEKEGKNGGGELRGKTMFQLWAQLQKADPTGVHCFGASVTLQVPKIGTLADEALCCDAASLWLCLNTLLACWLWHHQECPHSTKWATW